MKSSLVTLVLFLGVALVPSSAYEVFVLGSIDVASLTTTTSKPTLSGLAFGAKTVQIEIKKENSTKTIYKSNVLKVKNDSWKVKVSKKLKSGSYEVTLYSGKKSSGNVLATGTLAVETNKKNATKSNTTLVVQSVPLLFGGVAHAGGAVPISYLQINNVGKEVATLKGFWVKQNGSASTQSVIGFTTVDDKGGSRGSAGGTEGFVLFKNGLAFAPTAVVTFAPGEMKLFTIKAVLTGDVSYYLGQQLMMDVTSIDANANVTGSFPIRGTTWTIAN